MTFVGGCVCVWGGVARVHLYAAMRACMCLVREVAGHLHALTASYVLQGKGIDRWQWWTSWSPCAVNPVMLIIVVMLGAGMLLLPSFGHHRHFGQCVLYCLTN